MTHRVRVLRQFALALIAAMAVSSAAEARPAAIENGRDGGACPAVAVDDRHVVTGGCFAYFVSDDRLTIRDRLTHTDVVPVTGCEVDFVVRLGPDTAGYITNQFFSDCLTSCDDPSRGSPHPNIEWPIAGVAAAGRGAGDRTLTFTSCFRAPGVGEGSPGIECTIAADLVGTGRRQRLIARREPCAEAELLEVSGSWTREALDDPDEAPLALAPRDTIRG